MKPRTRDALADPCILQPREAHLSRLEDLREMRAGQAIDLNPTATMTAERATEITGAGAW